jgi:hypothetical protein
MLQNVVSMLVEWPLAVLGETHLTVRFPVPSLSDSAPAVCGDGGAMAEALAVMLCVLFVLASQTADPMGALHTQQMGPDLHPPTGCSQAGRHLSCAQDVRVCPVTRWSLCGDSDTF